MITCQPDMFLVKSPGSGVFSTRGNPLSILCAGAFHFRVRDGNGWFHPALTTRGLSPFTIKKYFKELSEVEYRRY